MGSLSPEIEAEFPIWRIWLAKGGDITMYKKWSYTDIMKANALLDMKEDIDSACNAFDERDNK